MRKKNASLILVGALTATAAVAGASASDQTSGSSTSTTTSTQNAYQTPPSPGSQSSTTSSTSQTQDSAYWAAQRLEMQKKSSEMRVKKVAEMKAAGIDVSALTGDILDGTKTEESVFWTAAKAAMDAHEIDARKKVLETLKAKGIDTSSITDDVISDGGKFWEAVRKLTQNGGASTQPTGTQTTAPTTPPSNPTGTTTSSNSSNELKSFLRSDLTQDELKAVEGIIAETGKSIFTILNDATLSVDDKIAKIQAAQRATAEKIASYVDSAKLEAFKA